MISFLIPWNDGDIFRERSYKYNISYLTSSFPDAEICIGGDNGNVFNRSKARNNAFNKSSNEIICILDADTIVPATSIIEGINLVKSKNTWVIPYNDYYNLTKEYSNYIIDNIDAADLDESNFKYDFKILSWAGALILTREMYSRLGGYDEEFEGWGWEDVAFRIKLDNEISKHIRCGSYVAHLWHPRKDADFGNSFELKNRKLFDRKYRKKYGWKDERI
jgi:predicted glycosyltransferase involved in capsule biosynthesis